MSNHLLGPWFFPHYRTDWTNQEYPTQRTRAADNRSDHKCPKETTGLIDNETGEEWGQDAGESTDGTLQTCPGPRQSRSCQGLRDREVVWRRHPQGHARC